MDANVKVGTLGCFFVCGWGVATLFQSLFRPESAGAGGGKFGTGEVGGETEA